MSRYVDPTEQLVVELLVRDLPRSLTFYRSLGFAVLREEAKFAVLTWEDHRLFLDQQEGLPDPPATPVMNVRVMVSDVDRLWQRVSDLGLRVTAPLEDRYYGLRDFTIVDPDGFGVRIATRIKPVS
jgi:catechol 2,3-dioxygenase-like lactoylglutathione lyase family enzyme